eukprot:COSAG06_NODE_1294_length_9970_cov_3.420120_7_plen_61_part_00
MKRQFARRGPRSWKAPPPVAKVGSEKQAQKRAPDLGLGELGRLSRRSGAKWLSLKVGSLQ